MTKKEAIKMLQARHDCIEKQCKGIYEDCNDSLCEECDLNYDQGTMGQQQISLLMAIAALKKEVIE